MMKRGKSCAAAGGILVLFLILARPAPAALGDIRQTWISLGTNWCGGGVAWQESCAGAVFPDGWIWEHSRGSEVIQQRDPETGALTGALVNHAYDKGALIAWDSIRGTFWMTDPYKTSGGDVIQLNPVTGQLISKFNSQIDQISGIYHHAATDRIWISGWYTRKFASFRPDGVQDTPMRYPGERVFGICRIGDRLWMGALSSSESNNPVKEYYLDGS